MGITTCRNSRVYGVSGFRVWGLGFRVWVFFGFGVWGLGFGVCGLGLNRTEVCYVEGDTRVVCTLSRMLLAQECASVILLVLAGKCGSNRIVISGQSGNYVIKHCESSSDLIQPMRVWGLGFRFWAFSLARIREGERFLVTGFKDFRFVYLKLPLKKGKCSLVGVHKSHIQKYKHQAHVRCSSFLSHIRGSRTSLNPNLAPEGLVWSLTSLKGF